MVISHKHRYLFIELPRTGTTAIARELRENYDGQSVLKKHSTYEDFLKNANAEERKYFVFSNVRNPLDKILSLYFKYKTDHRGAYSGGRFSSKQNALYRNFADKQFAYVSRNDATFPEFFKKFYRLPYDDWSCLSHHEFNTVLRFENLAEDFSRALSAMGVEQVRPLPVANKTAGRSGDFWSYYTPDVRAHAVWVFGPYMERWGYEFPPDWQVDEIPSSSRFTHRVVNVFRKTYWKFFR